MGLRIEYYNSSDLVMVASTSKSLVGAEKEAVAGLREFGADRAKIRDMDDGGKTLMVITGHNSS
jgi:hypothetical protein